MMQQTIATPVNPLRSLVLTLNPSAGIDSARLPFVCLQPKQQCMGHCNIHLKVLPFIDTPFSLFSNLPLLQAKNNRQHLIDDRLIRANRKRFSHDYHVGEEVLKLTYQPNKLSPRAEGPYRVHQVHTNGTVTLQKDAHTIERISIRRLKPYKH